MTPEPVKVLLVDDTKENLVALEAVLRRPGLQILPASSGAEALELLLQHEVALAILDVQMPELDGFALASLMRGAERTKRVPIIFLTAGNRDPERVFQGYEKGAVDFLYKPVEPQVLKGKAEVFFELYRQRQGLSSALRLNEMFVGILGHDLRNPLSAILTGASMLQKDNGDERQLRTLRRMSAAGQRMTDMIDQLLDLTRARLAGGLGFARTRRQIDLGQLVRRTVDELRGAHPERQVIVESAGDLRSAGDEGRLLQLFSNLIANALHHGEGGTPVKVTVESRERKLRVMVHNRGAIPAELQSTLFDPFRGRHGEVPGGGPRGLGLGLFISQQIALAHGGTLSVESNAAEGTQFTVHLPRRAGALKAAAPEPAARRTVMIVDDDEAIRDALGEAFTEEGYGVVTASNGREALDKLRLWKPRPDVVVLDLVLPVMDGSLVYQSMLADPALAKVPVIVSTSSPSKAPSGVTVVPKPLKLSELMEAVAELWR
jgi:two-component system sensor histidine kinase/response regulator